MRIYHLPLPCIAAVALSACSTLNQGPPPLRHTVRTDDASKVAYVSVATTNVVRWDDIAEDLNKPQFTPTAQQLLDDAVQVTSSVNAQTLDALSASLAATFAGASIDRSDTTSIDATGAESKTSSNQRVRKTPAMPPDVTFNLSAPGFPGSNAADVAGTEAQLKYDVAKALAEEVAIKNREVSSLAQRTGYRPYFVNMKVAVMPFQRGYPYDILLDLRFATSKGAPIVVPLLVTDAMEVTREAQTAQIVRQLGAVLRGSAGFVGASASLQRTLSRLDQTLAQRSNSLLTVAQYGANGVRVRLGANAYGETYEMISRTHSVSVIILVPFDVASQPDPQARMVAVSGGLTFFDAGGDRTSKDPGPPRGDPSLSLQPFQIPKRDAARCPAAQDAVLDVVSTEKSGSAPAAKYDSLVLGQGDGLQGRQLEASIDAPAPSIGGSLHLVATSIVATSNGTLQFTFPEHTSLVGGQRGALRTGRLVFRILPDDVEPALDCGAVLADVSEHPRYRVIYPMLATVSAKPTSKPVPATGGKGGKALSKPADAAAAALVAPSPSDQASAPVTRTIAPPTTPAYTPPK